MSHSKEQVMQIAIKFNLITQACHEELRRGSSFNAIMETLIKELLKVQEVILSNPSKNVTLSTVSNWIRNIVEKDEKMPTSLIGSQLINFCKDLERIQSNS